MSPEQPKAMEFPLTVELGFGTGLTVVKDASGQAWGYLASDPGFLRLFVYGDATRSKPLYRLDWDNFGPETQLSTVRGEKLGSVRRTPWRSIWRAHYVIRKGDVPVFEVTEENPFVKVLEFFIDSSKYISPFTGYVLNPTYCVTRIDGERVFQIKKERALHENYFSIHALGDLDVNEFDFALLAMLAFIGRESSRG